MANNRALLARLIARRDANIARIMAERKTAELAERIEAGDQAAAAELADLLDQAAHAAEHAGEVEHQGAVTPDGYLPPEALAEHERLRRQADRRARRAAERSSDPYQPKRRLAKPKAGAVGLTRRTGKNPATKVRKGLPS